MNTSGRYNAFSYCNIRHLCWLAAVFGLICWWCLPVAANTGSNNSVPLLAANQPSAKYHPGSFVKLGRYPQGRGGQIEPIQWLVLDKNGNTVFLLSRYALECKKFHNEFMCVSWRDCDLRKWLNNDFYNAAFNDDEKRIIVDSTIVTAGNPDYGTRGCGETTDKIFCLSIHEIWHYFGSSQVLKGKESENIETHSWRDTERSARATPYAVKQGVAVWGDDSTYRNQHREWWYDKCWYWLRTPGYDDNFAACVNDVGAVYGSGTIVDVDDFAVRPAMKIKLQDIADFSRK